MDKLKIAILGGRGMLGTDVAKECSAENISFRVFDLPEFDITDYRKLKAVIDKFPVIVNCAAYTDVEQAENQKRLACKVNAEAVGQLGILAEKHGAHVIHISTDFVFDGKSDRPYTETDTPNPVNTYGKTKLAGEQGLVESGCRYCIMRIEWTYGTTGKNFITKLISTAKNNKELKVVDDQIGSPTATREAAKVIGKLAVKKTEGIFHFANSGYVSRFELARHIFDKLNMPRSLKRCKTKDFPGRVERPLNSRFNCEKIKAILDKPIAPWQVPLGDFLKQL